MEHFDDEWLLVDRQSRQTHLLPDVAAQALFLLCKEPQDALSLTRNLSSSYEGMLSEDAQEEIADLIEQFVRLGWAEEVAG